MTDPYANFVRSSLGKKVAKNLSLPTPTKLDRFESGQQLIRGSVLIGSAPGDDEQVLQAAARVLADLHADVYVNSFDQHKSVLSQAGIDAKAHTGNQQTFKVLLFDASNIKTADQLSALYDFFHPVARALESSGRVIVLGRDPKFIDDIEYATAQRALVGFVKSVGKEFKRGISSQLLYVQSEAQDNLDSTLRFFTSARSAYVSGQVIRIGKGHSGEVDWGQPLAGKTLLVTGASRGIGAAIARVLARSGAHVICLDVPDQQAELQQVASQISGSSLAVDITDDDAGEQIVAAASKRGGLDGIIHNAGILRDKTLANMSQAQWQSVIAVNLASVGKLNRYLYEHEGLNSDARIVCVSSIAGIAGNMGQTNYATSKAGIIGLVEASATKLADTSMTINAVAPGFIETSMTESIPFATREVGRRMNAMSQGGQPIDVAETIAWLVSPASGGLNGNVIRVCGLNIMGA